MAYNLYQVQMAKAWAQRIDKENAQAEKFWAEQAMKNTSAGAQQQQRQYAGSVAPSQARSAAPTGYSSKSSFLKDRLEKLEMDLQQEKQYRQKVEEELAMLRTSPKLASKPATPY